MDLKTIPNAIAGAISSVYGNVFSLLQTITKSKKVNVSIGTFLVEAFIVIRPEFEGHRDVLMTLVAVLGTGNVVGFGVVDLAVAMKTGASKYQPKSA